MPHEFVIVSGVDRTVYSLLETEMAIDRESRATTIRAAELLRREAVARAPTPKRMVDEKGAGIFVDYNFPGTEPGGRRRLAGRFAGGATRIGRTYRANIGVKGYHLATFYERGTGLYGPEHKKYPIPKIGGAGSGKALFIKGWKFPPGGSQPHLGDFRGGELHEHLPIFDHVMHPGFKPRPFLDDVARANTARINLMYDRAVARAVRGL